MVVEGQEDAAHRVLATARGLLVHLLVVRRIKEMVSNDRVNLRTTEEAALSLEGAESPESEGDTDSGIDTILDAGEYCYEDTGEKDGHFDR